MPSACAQDKVKSTTSSMNYTYSHVLDYISYWLSMSVVFTLRDIMGLSIFVTYGGKERKNGSLEVVEVAI